MDNLPLRSLSIRTSVYFADFPASHVLKQVRTSNVIQLNGASGLFCTTAMAKSTSPRRCLRGTANQNRAIGPGGPMLFFIGGASSSHHQGFSVISLHVSCKCNINMYIYIYTHTYTYTYRYREREEELQPNKWVYQSIRAVPFLGM